MRHAVRFIIPLFILTSVPFFYCRIPAKWRQPEGDTIKSCGFFNFATLKNNIISYHFPDIQMIIDHEAKLKIESSIRNRLLKLRDECTFMCDLAKEIILHKETELHSYIINLEEENSEKLKNTIKHNLYLKEISKMVNELDDIKSKAVSNHQLRYRKAKGLLNKEQQKKITFLEKLREPFTVFLQNEK
jgi:hypothetical protein